MVCVPGLRPKYPPVSADKLRHYNVIILDKKDKVTEDMYKKYDDIIATKKQFGSFIKTQYDEPIATDKWGEPEMMLSRALKMKNSKKDEIIQKRDEKIEELNEKIRLVQQEYDEKIANVDKQINKQKRKAIDLDKLDDKECFDKMFQGITGYVPAYRVYKEIDVYGSQRRKKTKVEDDD